VVCAGLERGLQDLKAKLAPDLESSWDRDPDPDSMRWKVEPSGRRLWTEGTAEVIEHHGEA